jgi:hypothetical protein
MVVLLSSFKDNNKRDYYQFKIYTLETEEQEARMDQFLETAYLPALHRAGIEKVGVFKPIEKPADAMNYMMVFIPLHNLHQVEELAKKLSQDMAYQEQGKDYIQAPYDQAPYFRIESILLKAFKAMPEYGVPEFDTPRSERVYELRSYESATEQIHERKVEMFNKGESELFINLGFQPIFFGDVISGAHMPNLMYLTTHASVEAQEKNWEAFRTHPDWVKMKELERYLNTVSNTTKYLMYPTGYSDF